MKFRSAILFAASIIVQATAFPAAAQNLAPDPLLIETRECQFLKLFQCAGSVKDPDIAIASTIYNVAMAILALLSVIAFIIIVYCGVQYLISAGDSGRASRAKTCLLYAAIGLVIAGLSGMIVNAIINLGGV